jgi:hypothetical protein
MVTPSSSWTWPTALKNAIDVRTQVVRSAFTDFEITDPTEPGVIAPGPHPELTLMELLDEVIAWSRALKPLREAAPTGARA